MNQMLIDFKELSETSNLGLLSGRDNGIKAKTKFSMSEGNITPETQIIIKGGDTFVISNSYFLGLLEDFFKIHKTKKALLEHLDYSALSTINQKELIRGINRGFSSVVNAMA